MNPTEALKELLYKMADDFLILGHRNSEWTGVGPLLEEDIAFASMAQDKVGQAKALYELLQNLGEGEPDTVAFMRNAPQFHCCQLVELPIGEYDFSLIRHFLFDIQAQLRFDTLRQSSHAPLAALATKFYGELKYHSLHARVWVKKLGTATPEAVERLQSSLNEAMPYALGIFEPSPAEEVLMQEGIFVGEAALQTRWEQAIAEIISATALELPDMRLLTPVYGGRQGQHTPHLQPMLDEMTEVFRLDPTAEW